MPKIVDHDKRRDEIALVACRVVAEHGFEKASMVRIARGAGYTTGMLAHYFDSKQDIVIAALRLILRRIDERLTQPLGAAGARPDLLALLTEALPVDEQRRTECAFWTTFWGQVSTDKRLKRINGWVHREYLRLFERCLAQCWAEWSQWPAATREQVLRSLVTFINGLTAGAVANSGDWPSARQIEQLRLQLDLLHAWALGNAGAPPARKAAGA
jgi:TetR/AcrR family transcriptional repressor of bet genes